MTLSMKFLDRRIDELVAENAKLREELASHEHEQRPPLGHEHPQIQRNLLGQVRGLIRATIAVFETGSLNTEQVKAIHALRVVLGDAYGLGCPHENTAYEQGDRLICQDCREDITEAGDGTS